MGLGAYHPSNFGLTMSDCASWPHPYWGGSSKASDVSQSTTKLQDEASSQTLRCHHPTSYACTWICRMNNLWQRSSNAGTTAADTKATKRKSAASAIEEKKPKRLALRPLEFIPIPRDGDGEVPGTPEVRSSGTNCRYFTLDLDDTEDTNRALSAPLLPPPALQSDYEAEGDVLRESVTGEKGKPEEGFTGKPFRISCGTSRRN
jgi:hypothetical protein